MKEESIIEMGESTESERSGATRRRPPDLLYTPLDKTSLVDSLDSSGQTVAQRVEWLGGSNLPGFSRTYFEVPIRQGASRYRVSVFAFDFVQSARIESP